MWVIGKACVMKRSVGIVTTVNTQFCEGFLQDMQLLLLQKRHFKPSVLTNAIQ